MMGDWIKPMRRMGRWLVQVLAMLLVAAVALWGAGVLHFHLSGIAGGLLLLCWSALSVGLLLALAGASQRWQGRLGLAFMLGLLALGIGWNQITPAQDRAWADDVARRLQVRSFDGRHVVLDNVRNFTWRSEQDYDIAWEQRRYDLDQLRSADVLLSYWMGPVIAHTLVSFGFADGRQLVFSLEIRKEQGESFDALAGFFRRYEMTLVAADERDIVATRTNARGEEVYLYRVSGLRGKALRDLFVAYLRKAQELDRQPAFYNSLTSNCTTIVWVLARSINAELPLDWRLLASGYLAGYLQQLGALAPGHEQAELQQRGRITQRARADGGSTLFSQRIRQGVPGIDQGKTDE